MLFRKEDKARIRAGELTVSFRAWKSPRAKVGGRYNLHPEGAIEVTGLTALRIAEAKVKDVRAAGHASRDALASALKRTRDDVVYQVDFRYVGARLVKQPERTELAPEELTALEAKLQQMDARSSRDPWTTALLRAIASHPGTRAADLAADMGWETRTFKAHVRRLKTIGLTVSLEVGYQLSPRGRQILRRR